MPVSSSSTRTLGICLLASLALHLVLVGVLPSRAGPPADTGFSVPDSHESEVRVGIDRSNAVTITWIGFEEPTEHEAPLSEVEQAAMTLAELGAAPPGPLSTLPADAAPAQPAPATASQTAPDLPQVLRDDPEAVVRTVRKPADAKASGVEPAPSEVQNSEAVNAPAARAEAGGREGQEPNSDGAETRLKPVKLPGIPSSKEAVAAALKQAIDVRLGQPVARKGLDIKTAHARFTTSTRLTALPRNPVAQITFDKSGRVRHAEFLPGHATGFRHVDGPLLNSFYRWKATGSDLARLTETSPHLTITIRVFLR